MPPPSRLPTTLNAVLIVVIGLGAYNLLDDARTERKLRAEHDLLARQFSPLEIKDPYKFSVRQEPQSEKAHYKWLIHIPEFVPQQGDYFHVYIDWLGEPTREHWIDRQGGFYGSLGCAFFEYRVGTHDDQLHSFVNSSSFADLSRFLSPEPLGEFVFKHWEEMIVEVAADSEMQFDRANMFTLLTVRMPAKLQQQALQEVPEEMRSRTAALLAKPILTLRCGTKSAFKAAR